MQMRKTNHSYKSNRSKKIEKGAKFDMYDNGGFSTLNENGQREDDNDSGEEIE
jgi:hypothetical protein|tara:strand:- start:165 stop:323 length:159 start_codon:yes stop_codon:yes gene_type:complete